MSEWSLARVEQLAPDAAAMKAAQGLAKAAKWQNLGLNERLLWGECQGSGANPLPAGSTREGAPHFNAPLAAKLATLGVPAFACTPDRFPELMAAAIQHSDLRDWVASHVAR